MYRCSSREKIMLSACYNMLWTENREYWLLSDVPQTKGSGECTSVPQERKTCYKQVVTCSGQRTESIDCYPEITQEKGYGQCIGVDQEKTPCYKKQKTI